MNPSGILLLDKPPSISSAKALAKLKKHFSLQKIGHGGSLDPFATGLLVLLIGEATKLASFLLTGMKTYEAEAFLGKFSSTGDREGDLFLAPAPPLNQAIWEEKSTALMGKIEQLAPKYSALKYKGKAFYHYARCGQSVPRRKREVEISELKVQALSGDLLRFTVSCSGGTYIRVLAEDWASLCGTAAYLHSLRRTRVSNFHLKEAFSLESLLEQKTLPNLISMHEVSTGAHKLFCSSEEAKKICQGNQKVLHSFLSYHAKHISVDVKHIMLLQNEHSPSLFAILSRQYPKRELLNSFAIARIIHST